eukprot:m.40731 g.40731  ORF g.40731 m.40731 type:complete len:410 (+) comp12776_c0_seq1:222-1451(+)
MTACSSCLKWGAAVFIAAIAVLAMYKDHPTVQVTLMRFFRDVSRARSHARLYGNEAALSVFTSDDVTQLRQTLSEAPNVIFSPEELAQLDGSEGKPIYLSVAGRVYDVSSNRKTYGPKGTYHSLAAKDASRALALGCMSKRCLVSSLEGLTEKQLKELDRWVDFFDKHDKYHCVGRLQADDVVEQAVDAALKQDEFGLKMGGLTHTKLAERLAKGEKRESALLAVAEGTLLDGFKLHSRERMADAVSAFESGLMLLVEADPSQDEGAATALALLKGKLLMACATATMHQKHFADAMGYLKKAVHVLQGLEGDQACRLTATAYADLGILLKSVEDPDSHSVLKLAHRIYEQCPDVLEVPHVIGWLRTAHMLAKNKELTQADLDTLLKVVARFDDQRVQRMFDTVAATAAL